MNFKHLYSQGFLIQQDFQRLNKIFEDEVLFNFNIDRIRQTVNFNSIPYSLYLRKLEKEKIIFDEISEQGFLYLEFNSKLNYERCLELKREINSCVITESYLDISEISTLLLVSYDIRNKFQEKYRNTGLYKEFSGLPEVYSEFFLNRGNLDLQLNINLNLS
jgi:hypothetical protein